MFGIGSARDPTCATKGVSLTGTLMPACHTLASLLDFLKKNVVGSSHTNHDVRHVSRAVAQWYPRPTEYQKYVHWNKENPKAYTRNLIFHNDNMDVILMCWPAGSQSTIHDHDESSCWVVVVEGEAHEVRSVRARSARIQITLLCFASRECHSNHLCHSFISLEHQHSNAHSIITKYLTRALRSNTGTIRNASSRS